MYALFFKSQYAAVRIVVAVPAICTVAVPLMKTRQFVM